VSGFVYAISGGRRQVKIGWSTDPFRRLGEIRTGCPADAQLLGLVAAERHHEREIHALLAPWRLRAEWFLLSRPVAAFVNLLPRPAVYKIFDSGVEDHPLRAWRKRHRRSPEVFAAQIGVAVPSLSRYETGERIPEPFAMANIAATTNGQIMPNDFYGLSPGPVGEEVA
jgi:hypothetical protein